MDYKVIIPKEEPKQENFYEELKKYFEVTPREKVLEYWAKSAEFDKVGITVKDGYNFSTTDKELIEYAKRVWHELHPNPIEMTLFGADWQAKRMYSIIDEYVNDVMGGCNLRFEEWVKQYKK